MSSLFLALPGFSACTHKSALELFLGFGFLFGLPKLAPLRVACGMSTLSTTVAALPMLWAKRTVQLFVIEPCVCFRVTHCELIISQERTESKKELLVPGFFFLFLRTSNPSRKPVWKINIFLLVISVSVSTIALGLPRILLVCLSHCFPILS